VREPTPGKATEKEQSEQRRKSERPGATAKLEERESRLDEEGEAQPPASSDSESKEELGATEAPQHNPKTPEASPPGMVSESDRTKPKLPGAEHDDRDRVPVGGQHNQQNPQLKNRT
jgi:hypothetical protein